MNKISVTKNAKRNIAFGVVNKIVLMVLPFVNRAIINHTLGASYLGINSLYSSLLSVLALSEMGIGAALVYHMYKPVAEDDQSQINRLLNLYRKAYLIIGLVILGIGATLSLFLPSLVAGEYPNEINIYIVFYIQLINSAISYLMFGYKQSLLVAYQRNDITSITNLITQFTLQCAQIIILIITHNYYLYIICLPIFTIINNLVIVCFTKKMFPNAKCEGRLDKQILANIKKLVAGSFIQRACAITRNSFDSIFISAFIGLTLTAIYNNYYTIFHGVTMFLDILALSVSGGVGNHVVIKSKEENYNELKKMDMLYMIISGWCTVCLLCLSQPFMRLWMGKDMLMPIQSVVLMCVYFYTMKLGDMRGVYYSATGMWWHMRYRAIVETICNITLNYFLGKYFGINGIIVATVISIVVINFFWGSFILFKNYFGLNKIKDYFLYHLKYFSITVVISVIVFFICNYISITNPLLMLFCRGFVCTVLTGVLYYLINCKNQIFSEAIRMIRRK